GTRAQFVARRHRGPRRLCDLSRALSRTRSGLLRVHEPRDRASQRDAPRQGDPRTDHGGRRPFRPGASTRRQRAVRADHPERTVRADRWRAHDAGAGGSRAARAAAGFSRCAGGVHGGHAASEGIVAMKIKANGININYQVDGPEGAPWLIFSNSLATNLTVWHEQANELKQRSPVLRYDQPGRGTTAAPAGRYSFATLLDDAVALMDGLGIKKAHFAGLSMGGATALGLAETLPE